MNGVTQRPNRNDSGTGARMIGGRTTCGKRLVGDPLWLATGEVLHQLGERHGGWRWVVTFTMRAGLRGDQLLQAFRYFARGLATNIGEHYAVAFSIEYRNGRDGGHSHALLGGSAVGRVPKREIERSWKTSDDLAGFSRVARYQPGLGAGLYLAKDPEAWSGGVVCPRV